MTLDKRSLESWRKLALYFKDRYSPAQLDAIACACFEKTERGEATNLLHEAARITGTQCQCITCQDIRRAP